MCQDPLRWNSFFVSQGVLNTNNKNSRFRRCNALKQFSLAPLLILITVLNVAPASEPEPSGGAVPLNARATLSIVDMWDEWWIIKSVSEEKPNSEPVIGSKVNVAKAYQNLIKPTSDFDPNLPLLYPFVLNTRPERCPTSSGIKILVIIVHTERGHFLQREIIRKTWGSVKSYKNWDVKLVFIIGEKSLLEDVAINTKLLPEQERFGDISKSTFVDSYSNLTLKHAAGYSWVLANCPNATLVLKIDDDFVVDIFKLFKRMLVPRKKYEDQSTLWCRLYRNNSPIRNTTSNWFVSPSLYPKEKYPDFCSGGAYLTTVPTIRKLMDSAQRINRIPMDDVLFTGIAVEESNRVAALIPENKKIPVKHVDISAEYFYYHWDAKGMDVIRDWCRKPKSKASTFMFFLVEHGDKFFEDFICIWEKIRAFNSSAGYPHGR